MNLNSENQIQRSTPNNCYDFNNNNTTMINVDQTQQQQTTPNNINNNRNDDNNSYRFRNSISSIVNFYRRNSTDLIFDTNVFKQIKRLYCGMLLVSIVYSVTIVIMMMVLYKSLPAESIYYNHYHRLLKPNYNNKHSATISNNQQQASTLSSINLWAIDTTGQSLYRHYRDNNNQKINQRQYVSRNQLDQVIAINFLTSILYIMAFYAAYREFYHLTIAFTTTLAISLAISSIKILSEGQHLPNNLMGLLLRMSIVLIAIVYSSQIRRKQIFINQAQTFWLNYPHTAAAAAMLYNNNNSNNRSATVQLIQEMFGISQSTTNTTLIANHPMQSVNASVSSSSSSCKSDNIINKEYLDQPPNYEEALRCPIPIVSVVSTTEQPTTSTSSTTTVSVIEPLPSFDQIKI